MSWDEYQTAPFTSICEIGAHDWLTVGRRRNAEPALDNWTMSFEQVRAPRY